MFDNLSTKQKRESRQNIVVVTGGKIKIEFYILGEVSLYTCKTCK